MTKYCGPKDFAKKFDNHRASRNEHRDKSDDRRHEDRHDRRNDDHRAGRDDKHDDRHGGKHDGKHDGGHDNDHGPGCKPHDYPSHGGNTAPVARDDHARVCAGDDVVIDVLKNDHDRQDPASQLRIKIGGTVLDEVGETVQLDSGATVTLTHGGKLVYSSGDAFDSLARGAKTTDSFDYSVIDSKGAESRPADVDVRVTGATDTLAEIGSSLPDTLVFRLDVLEDVGRGLGDARLTLSGSNPGDARFDGLVVDSAYCIFPTGNFVDGAVVEASVYLGVESSVPAGVIARPENLDSINWILNEDFGARDNGDGVGAGYTEAEIQAAIWRLSDGQEYLVPGQGTSANATEIYSAALSQGDGFMPGRGDIVAIVLDPTDSAVAATGHEQPMVIGVRFEDLVQDCDSAPHKWCDVWS